MKNTKVAHMKIFKNIDKLIYINLFNRNSFKYNRYINFQYIKKKNKTYIKIHVKVCRIYKKNMFIDLIDQLKKFIKIKGGNSLRGEVMNKILTHKKFNCRYHFSRKMHCISFENLKLIVKSLKTFFSRYLTIRYEKLRLLVRNYKTKCTSCYIQAVKLKEYLEYSKISLRKAVSKILNYVIENGGRACIVQIKGTYKSKRTRTMRFSKGYMKHSGGRQKELVDTYNFDLKKKKTILGVKIKISNSNSNLRKLYKDQYTPGRISKLNKFNLVSNKIN